MPKDTFYFSHDYNARNDEKILELRSNYGAEGYGIFWMVVEAMAEGSDGGLKAGLIGGLALGFGIPKHKLLDILNYCIEIKLFFEKEGSYYSKRLLTHKEFRNSLSKWGKKGAEIRKGGLSIPISNERKENKKKVNINKEEKDIKFSIKGLGDFNIKVYTDCEDWQLKEMKDFLINSQQNFESIAMSNQTMNKIENFSVVLQEFVNMVQGTNDYQQSAQLRRFFGNWVNKKNGTLENFIIDSKNKSGNKKNANSWM